MKQELFQKKITTSIGSLYLVASFKGLRGLYWKKQPVSMDRSGKHPILSEASIQLQEYLKGERSIFELPLDFHGTAFQEKVWKTLLKIPYGQTCSYKELAQKIKNDKAIRAVGTANGKNPLSIIIPCHRVIASDRTLGGYSGGLSIKRQLLELEQQH